MPNAIIKFNNGNGTVLCNMCHTMLVDYCKVEEVIDCAHLCEKCWSAISADSRDMAHLAMRNRELEDFVRFIATDYVELSHDKVRWQRDDYVQRARKLRDVEDR